MEISSLLSSPVTLQELNIVRDEILQNPVKFNDVYLLIFNENSKLAWRAAWAVEKISEKNTSFFSENHILQLMSFYTENDNQDKCAYSPSNSLKREILSILINLSLPKNIPVEFINVCFDKIISMKEPVAIQTLCMKMLLRITDIEPDFITEIIVTLENIDLSRVTSGYIACRKNILQTLYKKSKS